MVVGNQSIDIQELWEKKVNIFSQNTAYFDRETSSVIFYTDNAVGTFTAYQNINLYIDLAAWHEETGRVVERKQYYNFSVLSAPDDMAINWSWGSSETSLNLATTGKYSSNSWIENAVAKTTIVTENDEVFTGNAYQKQVNQHETDYHIKLIIDGYKQVDGIVMDDNGDWSVNLSMMKLKEGDQIKAYVIGTEKHANANGIMNVKTSNVSVYTVGADSTKWKDWTINSAIISDAYDEETLISGVLPEQNLQNDRSYTAIISIDNQEVYRQKYDGEQQVFYAPIFDSTLIKGQKISVIIVGHEDGHPDKESKVVTTIVNENKNNQNSWDNWSVLQPKIVESTVIEGSSAIRTSVPSQNKFNGRTYELVTEINGQVIATQSVAKEGGIVTTFLSESLIEGDNVSVYVIGHESDEEDKTSLSDTMSVEDGTNWSEWSVQAPTLNEIQTTDTSISGFVGFQNTDFGRTYDLQVELNTKVIGIITVDSGEDYEFDLPIGTILNENDQLSVQVIGHQTNKDNKVSGKSTQTVQLAKHETHSNFDKGYWMDYGLVFEGTVDNEDWDLSNPSVITEQGLIYDEFGIIVGEVSAEKTNWYNSERYNGYQIIVDNNTLGLLSEGDYTIGLRVTINGQIVNEQKLQISHLISRMGPIHTNYNELEQTVLYENIVNPVIMDNTPGFTISKISLSQEVHIFNKYWNNDDQLVFDGYLLNVNLENITKKIEIYNTEGQLVYEKTSLTAAPDSWGIPTGVADNETFQVIIPKEYSDQTKFSYSIFVTDVNNFELLNSPLL